MKLLHYHSELINLFEEWAKNYKALSHSDSEPTFFRSHSEFMKKEIADRLVMVLSAPGGNYYDDQNDVKGKEHQYWIWFLKPMKTIDSDIEQDEIYSETQLIADDLMDYLTFQRERNRERLLARFKESNCSFDQLGRGEALKNNHFVGTELRIPIGTSRVTQYDPSDPKTKEKYHRW